MSCEPYNFDSLNYPKPHSVVGIDVAVLVSREATGGHEITLQTGEEGSGPPPHSHPWDESFYIVKGRVDFTVGNKTTKAVAGAFFHLPAGTVHGFRVEQNGTVMMEITGAGSQSSSMFRSISEEVAPGQPKPEDVPKLVEILSRFGANVHSEV